MAEFYNIFIVPKKDIPASKVQETMNLALDWFRYTSNVWIIYTSSDENKWYARLNQLVKPDGSLFICKLDISKRHGFMTKKFWDWLQENIKKQATQESPQ